MRAHVLVLAFVLGGCLKAPPFLGGGGDDAGPGGDGGGVDGPPITGMCVPGGVQCSNCVDDDSDGFIDGQDVECTGAIDNDEGAFGSGIPGDNLDSVNNDCFFDGNSGSGDDACDVHTCCVLGAPSVAACPIGQAQYDPVECPPPLGVMALPPTCIASCGDLAPPGCDCFGCCTICDPTSDACVDIMIKPAVSPSCDSTTISDPTMCPSCTKNLDCGNAKCGGSTCILCPGQDENSLDASCGGNAVCPAGLAACAQPGSICPANAYCQGGNGTPQAPGCCIGVP